MKVTLIPETHRGKAIIGIYFPYNFKLKETLKQFPKIRWSLSKGCFYIDYSDEKMTALKRFLGTHGIAVDASKFSSELKKLAAKPRVARGMLPSLSSAQVPVYDAFVAFLRGKRFSESRYAFIADLYMNFFGLIRTKHLKI